VNPAQFLLREINNEEFLLGAEDAAEETADAG
jgi:hypothetical protein